MQDETPALAERSRRLDVPGAELLLVEIGEGAPVVLLHGGPGASHDYLRPQMDRLAGPGRRLVYYDQRGGGRSALAPGAQRIEWDGTKRVGRLRDGDYEVVVEATDAIGTGVVRLPFSSDTRAPEVRIVSAKPLKLWVSEPAMLTLRVDGQSVKRAALAEGELRVPGHRSAARVRAVAWDAAGNKSAAVRLP